MPNIEIYVYEDLDELDFLDCQINKQRLRCGFAVKIQQNFYEVNFYTKTPLNCFNTESHHPYYSYPNIIIVEAITMTEINKALKYLYKGGYFNHLKSYASYESIKFYPNNQNYVGKLLKSVVSDMHKQ
jgi:hypothetical protein